MSDLQPVVCGYILSLFDTQKCNLFMEHTHRERGAERPRERERVLYWVKIQIKTYLR